MNQADRIKMSHVIITGRGDGSLKESMAMRMRFGVFRDTLRAKQAKRREEDQRAREEAAEALYEADIANHGHFCMEVWSRDCDMYESTHLGRYKSIKELEDSKMEAGEWAEGPITWTYISPEDAAGYESSHRDRIMENLENGGDGYHLGI